MPDDEILVRARRVAVMAPGRAVIHDGALVIRGGLVAEAGSWASLKTAGLPVQDLGEVTLVPGLVNAHTHLELSHLGLPPEPGRGFLAWVRWLLAQPLAGTTQESVAHAVDFMAEAGAAAVADIATRRPDLVAAVLGRGRLDWRIQYERFGYHPEAPLPDVPHERLALAGHALCTTSPEILCRAKAWDRERGAVFSIHLAEHQGEVSLLADGQGEFAALLRERVLPRDFAAPGLSPVAWADALGLLDQSTLAVHAVHVSPEDIATLKARGTMVCLCPRSNEIIGVGRAPVRAYLEAGVPCCLGTDSLASSPDLDLFGELRALLAYTELTLAQAAGLLSTTAARLYGFEGLGSLAAGCRARYAILPQDLEPALAD